ncbi:hypothetical protein B0O80DRAFT_496573 [Mortierella sp. GBAus27b]|nr:hypothetical protein BGX31_006953 [Mortierella sp. GBA43]KAI8356828.1 hypothetical protein B0O80DRAFT_496573 [Mortierella sp. GBAus27b]
MAGQAQPPPPGVQPKLPPVLPPPGSVPSGSGSGSGFVSGLEAAAQSALTLANTIAFRPMTTQPAKCSKLKIRIFFDSTIFQAGGNLFGRMEITATSSRSLKLGEIAVELAAYEEITSKEFTATQSFLSSQLAFQGPNIPPSNAVYGPCDENGFWVAKKGKTTFPFAFQLPLDCPSSLVFGQTASLRYVVTGLVQVFYHGKEETVLKSKEAFVVEAWDGYNPDHKLPVRASNSTKLFWGGSGALVLEAYLSQKLHTAGGNMTVEVKVKNGTSRKVQGIRLGVHRRLEMVSNKDTAQQNPGVSIDTVSVSETVGTQDFKSSSYLFDTGEERTTTVNMIVPGNARAIRGTALFEVTCFVMVSVLLGTFSGELSVEIPVKICHPASLTPAPKPNMDENHLPHHYNLVDEDMDQDPDLPTRSTRRVASNDSIAAPAYNRRELSWASDDGDKQGEFSAIGRQGEWSQDARELSPANSITSIKSLLASPKRGLGKLADKIQRSTSPSSSGHIHHEHRQGSKLIPKSPPLGPAMPLAYVPAVERVRYTPFQAPPTTKAKEFLKAAAQFQHEMGMNGALSGLDDNVEFDLDNNNKVASAIHQWISRKETEGMYSAKDANKSSSSIRPVSPIQIPSASPNRRRPVVNRINTQVGSFTSQYSPTGASPQSYDSPTAFGAPSPDATSFTDQTTSRFLHHAHRQPAAPQTEAFGSAPEDCMTDPPLFAKPLPLPSSPPTGVPMNASRARSLSPVPVPVQSPESLALAKQAFDRVKRIASPVQDNMMDAAAPGASRSTTRPRAEDPLHPLPPRRSNPSVKVPVAVQASSPPDFGSSPSGLSRLLSNSADTTQNPRPSYDAPNPQPPLGSSPGLQHIPLNRPLPIPAPKPRHLNQVNDSPGASSGFLSGSRDLGARPRPDPSVQPAPIPVSSTASGHLRNPQPVLASSSSPPRFEQPVARSSGHLPARDHETGRKPSTIQQHNVYVPKPTPIPNTRPPPAIHRDMNPGAGLPSKTKPGLPVKGSGIKGDTKTTGRSAATAIASTTAVAAGKTGGPSGSGFVYPKAARKPVSGVKPAVAAKPKNLSPQSISPGQVASKSPPRTVIDSNTAVESQLPTSIDSSSRQNKPAMSADDRAVNPERSLASAVLTRAPQVIVESQQQPIHTTQVVVGFETQTDVTVAVVGEDSEVSSAQEAEQQESGHDIRAQAIAAAHSFRATGAHAGGYVVNTGKLRRVIKDSNSNNNGSNGSGSSGQLIQAFAGGALNAASAAVSGLGWRQQSSTLATSEEAIEEEDIAPLPSRSHWSAEQQHDLTMKDIHFQTLMPSDPPRTLFDSVAMTTLTDTASTTTATTTFHQRQEGTKSHHLANREELTVVQQKQSRSQPGSRVIDNSLRQEPLPAMPVVLAVEAVPTPLTPSTLSNARVQQTNTSTDVQVASGRGVTSTLLPAAPNLDKTLPKIQEQTPRSRVFERPAEEETKNGDRVAPIMSEGSKSVATPSMDASLLSSPSSSTTLAANGPLAKPLPRPRYGQGNASPGTGSGVTGNGVSLGANKSINPKLQEYIQKYNLAANTRS